ncbi:MAG TPA: hypothetical protein DD727_03700 [Clostridiales bacterium]|nr:hypothetical protein [Clostridiales bacterium]
MTPEQDAAREKAGRNLAPALAFALLLSVLMVGCNRGPGSGKGSLSPGGSPAAASMRTATAVSGDTGVAKEGTEVVIHVKDFGAVGDGIRDDGPAITAALTEAKKIESPRRVVFEQKTYKIGDNPYSWHYFQISGQWDLTLEGNGATLLFSRQSLAFLFTDGGNITCRGFTLDVYEPLFTQGEVVAKNTDGTMDVRIMDGYPDPPVEAFLVKSNYPAYGGGGRHMIVFDAATGRRNMSMSSDHLYISNIRQISDRIFRFTVKENYLPAFAGVAVGNRVTYGFNGVTLDPAVVAAKNQSSSIYAQIAADRVENITLEDIIIYGSVNGGIRVSDMPGDVTLKQVRVMRKPGTQNLLSTISDALHLMNIRGRLVVDGCFVEAPGDDCINVGTMVEKILSQPAAGGRTMTLQTVDNRYYYYRIREGDELQFYDTASKKVLGTARVTRSLFDLSARTHQVALDREIAGLAPASAEVMDLGQMTLSTEIRGCTMKPVMRNAMLVRAQNMTIHDNTLDLSAGGVLGINLSYASFGDGARCRNITIENNHIINPTSWGILLSCPYRDSVGISDTRDLSILGNTFQADQGRAIQINGLDGLTLRDNRILRGGQVLADPSAYISLVNVTGMK